MISVHFLRFSFGVCVDFFRYFRTKKSSLFRIDINCTTVKVTAVNLNRTSTENNQFKLLNIRIHHSIDILLNFEFFSAFHLLIRFLFEFSICFSINKYWIAFWEKPFGKLLDLSSSRFHKLLMWINDFNLSLHVYCIAFEYKEESGDSEWCWL